jgi:hypothetical protein
MLRFVLAAIILASTLLPCSGARADVYAKPLAALVRVDGWSDALAAGVGIGRSVPELTQWLVVEAEFLKSFTKLERAEAQRSFSKTAAFAALVFPVDPRVFIKGKVGIRYASFDADGSGGDRDLGADWGVGALYLWDRSRMIALEYMTSDYNDFSQLVAGVQFHF